MGDTNLAKALPFSDRAIFDDRLISFLNGLNLLNEPFNVSESIRGSDIRSVFNAMHPGANNDRVAFIEALKTLNSQFGTELSLNHGASAVDASSAEVAAPPGSGVPIISDGGGNTSFRLTRIGPKAWHILISMRFYSAGAIGTVRTVWWKLNVPEALTEGSLFNTFFNALPSSEANAIPFMELNGADYDADFNQPLCIFRGSGSSSLDAIQFKDISNNIGWSTTASPPARQLGRTFSGTVVIP